jgi:ribosomal protein S18 acetylase RimI-like enzyme
MSRLALRKASLKDLPAIRDLATRFFREEKRKHDSQLLEGFPWAKAGEKEYRRLLTSRKAVTFIAEERSGAPRAYIIATVERTTGPWNEVRCVIYELFVDAGFRRQGTAKALMAKVRTWAMQHQADVLLVTAYSNSHAARRFYKRSGFGEWSTTFNRRLRKG